MVAWLLTGLAMAGAVYVNGVPVDPRYLSGLTLEKVNVKVDPQGNLYIDAPGYRVEAPPGAAPMAAPAAGGYPPSPYPPSPYPPSPYPPSPYPPSPYPPSPYPTQGAPVQGAGISGANPAFAPVGGGYPAPMAAPAAGAYGAPAPGMYGAVPAPMPAAPQQPYPNGIPRARWWLVTEDKISIGHSIEVLVNGQLVQTVKSGETQRIIDIGLFLRPGPNQVECKAFSAQGNNGMMYVYLGSGQDQQGTVKMDPPQVQFGVGTNTTFMSTRSYTLNAQ